MSTICAPANANIFMADFEYKYKAFFSSMLIKIAREK